MVLEDLIVVVIDEVIGVVHIMVDEDDLIVEDDLIEEADDIQGEDLIVVIEARVLSGTKLKADSVQ